MALQHLRSSTADKRPDPASMSDGQLAINLESTSPGLFFKDSGGALVKAGPVHVGTTAPNAVPAGESGNSVGEFWLDTSGSTYTLKAYDGTAWRTVALPTAGGAFTGNVTLNAQSDLRFADNDSSNWVAFQAPTTIASDVTWTLPGADGTSGQVLSTNGSGTLSWISNSTDNITEGNTTAEVVDTGVDGHFKVTTEGSERLRITADGSLGLGTSAPDDLLHLSADNTLIGSDWSLAKNLIRIEDTDTSQATGQVSGGIVFEGNDSNAGAAGVQAVITANANSSSGGGQLRFHTAAANTTLSGSEDPRLIIDGDGRLLVGTSSARNTFNTNQNLQIQLEGTTYATSAMGIVRNSANSGTPTFSLSKSRGTSAGSNTLVQNDDFLGTVAFEGADGSKLVHAARISAVVDGTPGADDMPGRLVFSSTPSGSASPVERMRITSDAYVRLASGTGGIQFNGDTAAANALDDYEEGTWTLVIDGPSGSITSSATYTKIGNLVNIRFSNNLSRSTLGNGTLSVGAGTSLPYTHSDNRSFATFALRSSTSNLDPAGGYSGGAWELKSNTLTIGRIGDANNFNAGLNGTLETTGSFNDFTISLNLWYRTT